MTLLQSSQSSGLRGKTEERESQQKKAVLGACVEAWQPSSKVEREGVGVEIKM